MQQALATLPWVEQSSIKVSVPQKVATFSVTNPDEFKLDAIQKVLPSRYRASKAKTGSSIVVQ